MKDFFDPEDFEEQFGSVEQARANRELSAKIANAKLNKLIESWPVVYGNFVDSRNWTKHETSMDTHTARLAFIEEIKKECVNHTPSWNGLKTIMSVDRFDNRFANVESVCMDCGVELVARFEIKEITLDHTP